MNLPLLLINNNVNFSPEESTESFKVILNPFLLRKNLIKITY